MFRKLKIGIAASAAIALTGTSAAAGGLSDQIVEAPVVEDVVAAPAGSSAPSWLIPLLIVGALVGLAASADGGSSDEPEEETDPPVDEKKDG